MACSELYRSQCVWAIEDISESSRQALNNPLHYSIRTHNLNVLNVFLHWFCILNYVWWFPHVYTFLAQNCQNPFKKPFLPNLSENRKKLYWNFRCEDESISRKRKENTRQHRRMFRGVRLCWMPAEPARGRMRRGCTARDRKTRYSNLCVITGILIKFMCNNWNPTTRQFKIAVVRR